METFDQQGGLNDKLGWHKAKDIPADLSWEQLGPNITAELESRKRRRLFWWWLSMGLSVLLAIAGFNYMSKVPNLGDFPIPGIAETTNSAVVERSGQGASDKASVQLAQEKPKAKSGEIDSHEASKYTETEKAEVSLAATNTAIQKNETIITQKHSTELSGKPLIKRIVLPEIDMIEKLAPKPVKRLDRADVIEGPLKTLPSNHSWIVETGLGFTFNLNPDTYSGQLPNSIIDPLTGIALSLRLGYSLQNRPYTIWTGVDMEELVQRERLEETSATLLYQPNTVDTIFRNSITGNTFTTTTDSVPGIRRVAIQQHSIFRSWSAPVLLGRTWAASGWQLEGRAGVDVNLSTWRSGGYLTEGYQLEQATAQYHIGWSVRIEGQLLLPPTRFGRLFIRCGYRRSMDQPVGLAQGGSFRPEAIGAVIGWRSNW